MEPVYSLLGADRRLGHRGVHPEERARRVRLRRHLRLGQRGRLRLPARPAGHRRRRPGAAAAGDRDRRRGRLDPDRRGPGADGAGRRASPASRTRCTPPPRWSAACARAGDYTVADDGRSVAAHHRRPGRRRGQARRHRPVRRGARRRSSPRSTWRCTPTPCCTATSTTSSATARSSWSTRCAAGSPSAAAGRTGCRPRSRPRRAWTPPPRARCSARSPCRRSSALYPTVCGMTATAVYVGDQLREFFKLEVAVIPPNTPCIREDEPDRDLRHPGREGRGADRRDQRARTRPAGRCWSARSTSRSPRSWPPTLAAAGVSLRRAQREERRRGGGDHRRGRRVRRGDRLHPDGRPGRRHPPRRQRPRPTGTRSPSWAGSTSSAAAGTTAAGSTTSCAAGPAGRATRAARSFFVSLEDDLVVRATPATRCRRRRG